jgi:hypothetical protein
VKSAYFDSRSYTWYARAGLEKARTGEAVLERIDQHLSQSARSLANLSGKPLSDFLLLRQLETLSPELEWFLVAATLFCSEESAKSAKTRVRQLQRDIDRRRQVVQPRVRLALVLQASDDRPLPEDLRQSLQAALQTLGLTLIAGDSPQTLVVSVNMNTMLERGTVTLTSVTCGASFALREQGELLRRGELALDTRTKARFLDPVVARQRSLKRLQPLLVKAILQTLESQP